MIADKDEIADVVENILRHLTVIQASLSTLRQYFLAKMQQIPIKPDYVKKRGFANTVKVGGKLFI